MAKIDSCLRGFTVLPLNQNNQAWDLGSTDTPLFVSGVQTLRSIVLGEYRHSNICIGSTDTPINYFKGVPTLQYWYREYRHSNNFFGKYKHSSSLEPLIMFKCLMMGFLHLYIFLFKPSYGMKDTMGKSHCGDISKNYLHVQFKFMLMSISWN